MTTETSTTTFDNLIGTDVPVVVEGVTVDASQTLARGAAVGKKTVGAVTAAAGTNTGDGTCTALAALVSPVPQVGDYVLTCTAAVTHGGVFKLVDPVGNIVATNLTMTASTGAATVFKAGGLTFTLTDGATDFAAGDSFTITVAAGNGYVVALDKTAVTGAQKIYGIMLDAVTVGSGATGVGSCALTGSFNSDTVTFVSGTAVADVAEDARTKGIFFVNGAY